MNLIINNIHIDHVECTPFSSKDREYVEGYSNIDYTIINGSNELRGIMRMTGISDMTINQIKEKVMEQIKQDFFK